MAFFSASTIRRVLTALSSQKSGNEILGSLGQYGGFRLNSNGTVASSSGDIVAIPDSGGAVGTYRVLMPSINNNIQSIDWVCVQGFTPRTPTGVETCDARVTGFNHDASTNQWYITVQVVLLSSGAVDATPPQGFTVGVRASVTLTPQANAL